MRRASGGILNPMMEERFTPENFLDLLKREDEWFQTLMRIEELRAWSLAHRSETGVDERTIKLMLRDRARELRN